MIITNQYFYLVLAFPFWHYHLIIKFEALSVIIEISEYFLSSFVDMNIHIIAIPIKHLRELVFSSII